ncbi:MAG: type II toxin-antitoxin system HicA family toxin [Planctomycetia bacterium]
MQLTSDGSTRTIPVPNHAELRTGTLRSIIRQSGVSKTEFETP